MSQNQKIMKKSHLLFCFVLMVFQSISQIDNGLTASFAREIVPHIEEHNNGNSSYRGGETPVWFSDFSDPGVWQMNTITGPNGFEISTSEQGWFYEGNINSDSGGEYAFVWSGDLANGFLDAESTMSIINPIDVSMLESAVIEFQLYGARFDDELFLEVSTDGIDYETVGNISDIGNFNFFGGTSTLNPTNRAHNITLNVQDLDDIWLRFRHKTGESGGSYGWFLDDVYLYEALENDLRLDNVHSGFLPGNFAHAQIPLEQNIGLNLTAEVTNMGANTSENTRLYFEVFQEGITDPIYTEECVPLADYIENPNLDPNDTEILYCFSNFEAKEIGKYTVMVEVIQDLPDLFIENNIMELDFEITASTWANDVDVAVPNIWNGANGGPVLATDAWSLGTAFFPFNEDSFCHGMAVNFDGGSDADAEVSISLWGVNKYTGDVKLLASTPYTLTELDADPNNNDFTIIPFGKPIPLTPGFEHILTLDHPQQENEVHIVCQPYDYDNSTWIVGDYAGYGEEWLMVDVISPAIRLLTNIDNSVGIDETHTEILQVGQNFPNPANGNTTIPFSLTNTSAVSIRILDVTGKVVYQNEFGKFSPGYNEISIENLNLNSGIYTYQVSTDSYTISKKMLNN